MIGIRAAFVALALLVGTAWAQTEEQRKTLEWEAQFFAPSPAPTPGVQADVDAARALLRSGDREGATARFRKAVARDPSNPAVQELASMLGATPVPVATRAAEADAIAAKALLAAGETDRATEKFLDLVEKDPAVALQVGSEVGQGKADARVATREGARADMEVVLDAHERVEYSSGPLRNLDLTSVLLGLMAVVVALSAVYAFRRRG